MRSHRSAALWFCLVSACSTTNTGNPVAPDGVKLARSSLKRDTAPDVSAEDQARLGEGNRDFAFSLYQAIRDRGGNLFYSPYSISVALAMTYAGAEGVTENEMAAAMHFDLPEPTLHAAFNAADLSLQGRADERARKGGNGFTLNVTNAMFMALGLQPKADYLDTLAVSYGAGLFLADFAADPEGQRLAINDWTGQRTRGRIPELLPARSIASDVAFVLVNAIYFKASWLEPFDRDRTQPAVFHAPAGDVSVSTMHGGGTWYMRGDDYQALELPYVSDAVRMLIVLPDEGQFEAVEARMNRELFDQTRAALGGYAVTVQLPRFTFEAGFELKDALTELGMVSAFSAADFSGIAGLPGDIFIDQVYHKAFVAVDEEGTEAAAATAVVGRQLSAPPPAEFIADRPFLFFIHDEPAGQILFAGRLTQPDD